ncbi:hypothetical protein SSU10_01501 [Streptococcus suis]|nr:hypothetical protein SSU10_01501 [Streptococcus suis]
MLEEVLEIAQAIKQQNRKLVDQWLAVAESVHQTLYTMRPDAGIIFKADNNEI